MELTRPEQPVFIELTWQEAKDLEVVLKWAEGVCNGVMRVETLRKDLHSLLVKEMCR